MKKYFIPIKRKSIRKVTSNSFVTEYLRLGKTISFKAQFVGSYNDAVRLFPEDKYCILNVYVKFGLNELNFIEGEILPGYFDEKGIDFFIKNGISVEINYNHQLIPNVIGGNSGPEYNYEYKKVKIKCQNCKEKSNHDEFSDDWIWNGEDEYLVDNICPKCHLSNDFKIEYENINNIV